MPSTGNIAIYSGIRMSWILEENLKPPLLLNQNKLQLHSKYLSLYLPMSVVLTTHQANFSLKQTETMTKTTTHQNPELGSTVPVDSFSSTFMPKAQETLQKRRWKDCRRQRIEEFSVRLCLLVI